MGAGRGVACDVRARAAVAVQAMLVDVVLGAACFVLGTVWCCVHGLEKGVEGRRRLGGVVFLGCVHGWAASREERAGRADFTHLVMPLARLAPAEDPIVEVKPLSFFFFFWVDARINSRK